MSTTANNKGIAPNGWIQSYTLDLTNAGTTEHQLIAHKALPCEAGAIAVQNPTAAEIIVTMTQHETMQYNPTDQQVVVPPYYYQTFPQALFRHIAVFAKTGEPDTSQLVTISAYEDLPPASIPLSPRNSHTDVWFEAEIPANVNFVLNSPWGGYINMTSSLSTWYSLKKGFQATITDGGSSGWIGSIDTGINFAGNLNLAGAQAFGGTPLSFTLETGSNVNMYVAWVSGAYGSWWRIKTGDNATIGESGMTQLIEENGNIDIGNAAIIATNSLTLMNVDIHMGDGALFNGSSIAGAGTAMTFEGNMILEENARFYMETNVSANNRSLIRVRKGGYLSGGLTMGYSLLDVGSGADCYLMNNLEETEYHVGPGAVVDDSNSSAGTGTVATYTNSSVNIEGGAYVDIFDIGNRLYNRIRVGKAAQFNWNTDANSDTLQSPNSPAVTQTLIDVDATAQLTMWQNQSGTITGTQAIIPPGQNIVLGAFDSSTLATSWDFSGSITNPLYVTKSNTAISGAVAISNPQMMPSLQWITNVTAISGTATFTLTQTDPITKSTFTLSSATVSATGPVQNLITGLIASEFDISWSMASTSDTMTFDMLLMGAGTKATTF